MNELPPEHETIPEPETTSGEKPPIRKAQEEYVDDMAGPSMDKSEYARRKADGTVSRRETDGEDTARLEDQRKA